MVHVNLCSNNRKIKIGYFVIKRTNSTNYNCLTETLGRRMVPKSEYKTYWHLTRYWILKQSDGKKEKVNLNWPLHNELQISYVLSFVKRSHFYSVGQKQCRCYIYVYYCCYVVSWRNAIGWALLSRHVVALSFTLYRGQPIVVMYVDYCCHVMSG